MASYILKSYKLKVDPFAVFEALSREKNSFFLDSSLRTQALGRFSFLGISPFFILKSVKREPFSRLRELLNEYRIPSPHPEFPLLGAAVGYLAYDLGVILEQKVRARSKPDPGIADCYFGFYNSIVGIDHLKRRLYISCVGFPEKKSYLAALLCRQNLKALERLLSRINTARRTKTSAIKKFTPEPESDFEKEDYLRAVKKAKDYIRAGDIYQVNLSQRFQASTCLDAVEIYRRLRKISPSFFSAYCDCTDAQVISSSPERFLKLEGDLVTTRPMKGTRPRGRDKKDDLRLEAQLLNSAKDKAELVMIVDLERNDLGKVCSYDTVQVDSLRQLERYNTVFQTTATVCGRLHKDKDRIDLLRACFPGGSITGCPKIRAMEIIEELEPSRRSIYTGCLGYLSFSGGMDFNILIRMLLKKQERLFFGVGGGVVADSSPEGEYRETLVKAKAMLQALDAL
jgi:para-aminobenzoate synthetase component 1